MDLTPCPFCAEGIQFEASHCRFCDRDVRVDVVLLRVPPAPNQTALTKDLVQLLGNRPVGSYGTLRKLLTEKGSTIALDCTRGNAQQVLDLLEKAEGAGQIQLHEESTHLNPSSEPNPTRKIAFILLLAAFAGAGFFFIHRRNSENLLTASTPLIASQRVEEPDTDKDDQSPNRNSLSPSDPSNLQAEQKIRTHLKSLIEATATLSSEGVTGSAFFIQSEGYLITNDHVTNKMTAIKVQTSDGKVRPGKVIRTEPQYDLALVKVEGGPYPVLTLGDATKLEQGETVWTIGAPHGLSFTVTRGIVSFVGRRLNGRAFVQADVAINPGNSGGPMINSQGEVIGINNFIISNAVGLNFAIPINYVYMGPKPIAQSTIPTQADNGIMAEWRSWEVPNQAQVANFQERQSQPFNSPPSAARSSEMDGILSQMNQLDDNFTDKKNRADAAINQLKAERDRLQKSYDSADMNISSETEFGKRISAFTKDILKQELAFIEDTLSYCNSMEPLLQQAGNAVEPSRRPAVESKASSIRQMRTEALSLKEAKSSELRTESEKVY